MLHYSMTMLAEQFNRSQSFGGTTYNLLNNEYPQRFRFIKC